MNIKACSNNLSYNKRVMQFMLDKFPCKNGQVTVKSEKAVNFVTWVGEKISSPENRLIMGITALFLQPLFDIFNKDVDEKTRKVSVCRTLAKIIAGTTTGVIIRRLCIKMMDAFTQNNISKDIKKFKWKTCFLPMIKDIKGEQFTQYKNSLGSIVSLPIFCVTNFLIDAPLTKDLTNLFVKGVEKNEQVK